MPHKPTNFENVYDWWTFTMERRKQAGLAPAFDDDFKRALIDLVRSETPLDANKVRGWLADELENSYFPLPKDEERGRARQRRDAAYRFAIERIAKAKDVSKEQAKEDLSAILGLEIEALNQRLKRARRELKKGNKKT